MKQNPTKHFITLRKKQEWCIPSSTEFQGNVSKMWNQLQPALPLIKVYIFEINVYYLFKQYISTREIDLFRFPDFNFVKFY